MISNAIHIIMMSETCKVNFKSIKLIICQMKKKKCWPNLYSIKLLYF